MDKPIVDFKRSTAPAPFQEEFNSACKLIARHRLTTIERVFTEAILDACGGVMPSVEESVARGRVVYTHDGTTHLLWDHGPLELGDTPDMSKCIASVGAPEIFDAGKPNTMKS